LQGSTLAEFCSGSRSGHLSLTPPVLMTTNPRINTVNPPMAPPIIAPRIRAVMAGHVMSMPSFVIHGRINLHRVSRARGDRSFHH